MRAGGAASDLCQCSMSASPALPDRNQGGIPHSVRNDGQCKCEEGFLVRLGGLRMTILVGECGKCEEGFLAPLGMTASANAKRNSSSA